MSKERELLTRLVESGVLGGYSFIAEVKEILAQPEQTDQKPVGIVITMGGYPDDSVHTVELTCRHGALKDGDLLYTAPQKPELTVTKREAYQRGYAQAEEDLKREPLSDEEVIAKYRAIAVDNALYVPTYYAGFRDAEKAHGIGGGK